jgi:hypothetical protein
VNKDTTALAPHAVIGDPAWTHIARPQQPPVGPTALAGAENAGGGIGDQDRGLCPDQYPGQGRETGTIMVGSRGHKQDRDPLNVVVRVLILGPGPVRGLARGRGLGRGRAIGEAVDESAYVGLAPKVGRRVAAAVAAGNANGEEREVARRTYVLIDSFIRLLSYSIIRLQREKRERRKNGMASAAVGGQWGKYGIISESEYVWAATNHVF